MKLKIIAIIVLGLIIASVSYLYVTRNHPILYRYEARYLAEPNKSAFIIQNPFRERGPEDEAEKIFQDLKAGNCEKALTLPALAAQKVQDTCEREGFYPIQSWSIVDREDIGNKAVLVYKVYRNDHGDTIPEATNTFHGLVWIDVEKAGDNWRPLSYQAYY